MSEEPAVSRGNPTPPQATVPGADSAHDTRVVPSLHRGHPHLPFDLGFIEKLKRRNVGRVAILYVMVCYVILEPFEMFFHLLELPAWVGRSVVGLMALGLPAAMLFAWAYEVTPEGLKPSAEVDPARSIVRQTGRRLDRAIIIVLAVALAYFVADKFWFSRHTAVAATAERATAPAPPSSLVTVPEKSIAVLPLTDLSEKRDQEYFADGLTEELIDLLTKSTDLRVPASTSSFYFKGKQATISQIAAALAVRYVLEGSVRKAGNRLRVTAQLVRTSDGYHLWSETYDRELQDVFKVQDDIANAVVSVLKAKLSGTPAALGVRRTASTQAYNEYLIARSFVKRSGREDFARAEQAFEKALELDPNFSAARVGLAEVQYLGAQDRGELTAERFAQIQQRLDRAIATDPDLADGYSERGVQILETVGDLGRAGQDLSRALTLDPSDSANQRRWGFLQACLGNDPEAISYATKATDMDPLDVFGWYHLGTTLAAAGRLADANAALARGVQINPAASGALENLMRVQLIQGQAGQVMQSLGKLPDPSDRLYLGAMAEHSLGHEAQSRNLLDTYIRRAGRQDYIGIADVYAWRGETRQALEWLERTADYQGGNLACLRLDPFFTPLRNDPRLRALLQKHGMQQHLPPP